MWLFHHSAITLEFNATILHAIKITKKYEGTRAFGGWKGSENVCD